MRPKKATSKSIAKDRKEESAETQNVDESIGKGLENLCENYNEGGRLRT